MCKRHGSASSDGGPPSVTEPRLNASTGGGLADAVGRSYASPMRRPRIGITTDTHDKPDHYESPMAYATAVEKAGGLPLLLPYRTDVSLIPQIVDLLDGMLFSGGN